MIRKTILFSNPCRLYKKDLQMMIDYEDGVPPKSVPIEDIGILILEESRITLTHSLLKTLMENNAVLISCNDSHLPESIMLPMFAHHTFTEKMLAQIESSLPLKKNLWQQTVVAKINNQCGVLEMQGIPTGKMRAWAGGVRSGDAGNAEAHAAAYYWGQMFDDIPEFSRERFGDYPNNYLNYGYAILRAVIARSLVASGLFPPLGIHHRNKYNYWCLADDIMEPYRPYVDMKVKQIMKDFPDSSELSKDIRKELLGIPVMDVKIEGKSSPLMIASQRTTASLSACFEGSSRRIVYPLIGD